MVSPLAPGRFPDMPPLSGVTIATGTSGSCRRENLLVIHCARPAAVAGVLTRSSLPAAPVHLCRERLKSGVFRALVVNAGNAIASSGASEHADVRAITDRVAGLIGCRPEECLMASTGVIGVPAPVAEMIATLDGGLRTAGWEDAARAIMTTDTFPKGCFRQCRTPTANYTIHGIAKGSGMIAPDMATMLSFIFTDAPLTAEQLRGLLRHAAARSFNCVTVDGDTSTNDTVLLIATGSGAAATGRELSALRRALVEVCQDLAWQIAGDGEGAHKRIRVVVNGARSHRQASLLARSIAESPLVKTAIHGADPNWGRVIMAIGKSGVEVDPERLHVAFGDTVLDPQQPETVALARQHLGGQDVLLTVTLALGPGEAEIWTCDLSADYVRINADYTS